MPHLRLYLDENAMHQSLLKGLRERGFDVQSAHEAAMLARSDHEHLAYAVRVERSVFTFDVGDFSALHAEYVSTGRRHAGVILEPNQRLPIGELLRRLQRLDAALDGASMENRLEYLSAYG